MNRKNIKQDYSKNSELGKVFGQIFCKNANIYMKNKPKLKPKKKNLIKKIGQLKTKECLV